MRAASSASAPASCSAGRPKRAASAGPAASPSRQSPWNGQQPAKVSPVSRGTERWPISGCGRPCSRRPSATTPPPMPVPTVRYATVAQPRAAPSSVSARAAALTSVSRATRTPSARASVPATSAPPQRCLGVATRRPQPGAVRRSSTGPKAAMPTAASGPRPSRAACSRTVAAACASVVSGSSVGRRSSASTVPSPRPSATTVLVPPSSMPATRAPAGGVARWSPTR